MKRTWYYQYLLNLSHQRVAPPVGLGDLDRDTWKDSLIVLIREELKSGSYRDEILALLKLAEGSARKAADIVLDSIVEVPQTANGGAKYKILDLRPFVKTLDNKIGIAADGTTAATAWRLGDEAFRQIGGSKFSWIAPDGESYVDNKAIFTRPTEGEVLALISPELTRRALEIGILTPEN